MVFPRALRLAPSTFAPGWAAPSAPMATSAWISRSHTPPKCALITSVERLAGRPTVWLPGPAPLATPRLGICQVLEVWDVVEIGVREVVVWAKRGKGNHVSRGSRDGQMQCNL
ncbi:hypothetical protein F5X68DRAFT_59176 [Plectosphaerella plurivora]|uniref:Uncharacterized protein n=1 Tax=Plectosphaerella plurivora TaxID=936078 RepID=A0A9P8VJZ5_9PEZI|nr:hypothetical protein F5X68DRAFT_59176 [Plectosphaerella plurivora]